MDNFENIYHQIQIIFQKILVYLRDLIIHEFPNLISPNESNGTMDEIKELKNRLTSSIQHNFVDLATIFILTSFTVVLIILSVKGNKDDSDDYFIDKSSKNRFIMDLPEDLIYDFPKNWNSEINNNYYRDRGDEYFSEGNESPKKENRCKKKYKSRKNSNNTPSIYGDYADINSEYKQRTENMKNKLNRQLWLVRKTRSGQIYGKYPI